MSLLINTENYEAFYLDFIEGNLNEAENRAFLIFLAENPDLIQDEDLMSFNLENTLESLDNDFIKKLKVFDKSEAISAENYENFMLSSIEKQLETAKQKELKDFLTNDKKFQEEFNLYQKTILIPDTKIVYSKKNKLKRGIVIPLFSKFMIIAAVLAIIFFTIPTNNPNLSSSKLVASRKTKIYDPRNKLINSYNKNCKSIFHPIISKKSGIKRKRETLDNINNFESNYLVLIELKVRKVTIEVDSKKREIEIFPAVFASSFENNKKSVLNTIEDEQTYLAFSKMENPAKFFTTIVAEKFKTKVDFRIAKASSKKQGGFFIKIGKFELSRKTAPQDVLALN